MLNTVSVLHKGAIVSMIVGLLSACATTPTPGGTSPRRDPATGGHSQLAPNTEPRFVQYGRAETTEIAVLQPAGNNVFVDGERVKSTIKLLNNAFVHTGVQSSARIIYHPTRGECRIGILEMQMGKLYSETSKCLHETETIHSEGRTTKSSTVYHLDVSNRGTEITVIRGQMEAWLRTDPTRAVVINAFEDALLRREQIVGPRKVTESEIRERTDWTDDYSFEQPSGSDAIGKAVTGAAILGIGAILFDMFGDDEDEGEAGGDVIERQWQETFDRRP